MSGFELYLQRDDGTRDEPIARGPMGLIVQHVRAMGLIQVKDPNHPLGVFFLDAKKRVFVIDFFLGRG